MKARLKISIFCGIIALVAVITTIVTYAWFYYPAQTPVTAKSGDDIPVEVNLYKYVAVYNSEADAYAYEWSQVTAANNSLTINPSVTFFQWGDEFIAENFYAEYYVLECTLDSEDYASGNFKAVLDASFDCKNGYTQDDETTQIFTYNYIDNETTSTTNVNLRIPLVTLSYCLLDDANATIENSTAFINQLTGATYTEFTFDGEEDFVSESLLFEGSYQKSFQGESTTKFISDDTVRLIFFIKVDDNSADVNDYLGHVDEIGENDILLDNDIELTVSFKSIPKKTE